MNRPDTQIAQGSRSSRTLLVNRLQSYVDGAAAYGACPPVDLEVLADTPYTILISLRESAHGDRLSSALECIARKLFRSSNNAQKFLFRGVNLSRLSQVTSTGCDVTPPTAPIHASPYANKALEYGEVVMVFNSAKLDKTFRRVQKSESPEKLSRLREEYPTVTEVDSDWLWFSKLPLGDDRIGTIYESHYTFFIPGDAHEALLLIFLVGNNRDELRTEFQRCARSSSR